MIRVKYRFAELTICAKIRMEFFPNANEIFTSTNHCLAISDNGRVGANTLFQPSQQQCDGWHSAIPAEPTDLSHIGVLGEKWETDKRGRRSTFMHNGVEMSISRELQSDESEPQTDTTSQSRPGTLLWEVSKPGVAHKSYLFGTFHEVDADFFASLPAAVARLNDATVLYVEETLAQSQDTTHLPENDPWNQERWDAILNSEQQKVFSAFVAKAENREYYLAPPALTTLTMSRLYLQNFCDTETRTTYDLMDLRIQDIALAQNKEIVSLDERQIDFLIQEAQTLDSLKNVQQVTTSIVIMQAMLDDDTIGCQLIKDYKNFKLDYQLNQEAGADGIALLVKRNNAWLKILIPTFQREKCFVAVGYGHLFYKEGLITQLRNRGYQVVPIPLH